MQQIEFFIVDRQPSTVDRPKAYRVYRVIRVNRVIWEFPSPKLEGEPEGRGRVFD